MSPFEHYRAVLSRITTAAKQLAVQRQFGPETRGDGVVHETDGYHRC